MKRKYLDKDREVQKRDVEVQKYVKKLESNEKKLSDRDNTILEKTNEIASLKATIEQNDKLFHSKVPTIFTTFIYFN